MIITKQEANAYSKKTFTAAEKLEEARRVVNYLIKRNYKRIQKGKVNLKTDLELSKSQWTKLEGDYSSVGITIKYDARGFIAVNI